MWYLAQHLQKCGVPVCKTLSYVALQLKSALQLVCLAMSHEILSCVAFILSACLVLPSQPP